MASPQKRGWAAPKRPERRGQRAGPAPAGPQRSGGANGLPAPRPRLRGSAAHPRLPGRGLKQRRRARAASASWTLQDEAVPRIVDRSIDRSRLCRADTLTPPVPAQRYDRPLRSASALPGRRPAAGIRAGTPRRAGGSAASNRASQTRTGHGVRARNRARRPPARAVCPRGRDRAPHPVRDARPGSVRPQPRSTPRPAPAGRRQPIVTARPRPEPGRGGAARAAP